MYESRGRGYESRGRGYEFYERVLVLDGTLNLSGCVGYVVNIL